MRPETRIHLDYACSDYTVFGRLRVDWVRNVNRMVEGRLLKTVGTRWTGFLLVVEDSTVNIEEPTF